VNVLYRTPVKIDAIGEGERLAYVQFRECTLRNRETKAGKDLESIVVVSRLTGCDSHNPHDQSRVKVHNGYPGSLLLSPDRPRCRTGVYVPCKTRALPRGVSNVGVYVPWVRRPLAVLNDRLWTRLGPLATNDRPRTMINDRRPKSSKRIAKARTVKAYTYLASPWTCRALALTRASDWPQDPD